VLISIIVRSGCQPCADHGNLRLGLQKNFVLISFSVRSGRQKHCVLISIIMHSGRRRNCMLLSIIVRLGRQNICMLRAAKQVCADQHNYALRA